MVKWNENRRDYANSFIIKWHLHQKLINIVTEWSCVKHRMVISQRERRKKDIRTIFNEIQRRIWGESISLVKLILEYN